MSLLPSCPRLGTDVYAHRIIDSSLNVIQYSTFWTTRYLFRLMTSSIAQAYWKYVFLAFIWLCGVLQTDSYPESCMDEAYDFTGVAF